MRGKSSGYRDDEPHSFGCAVSKYDFEPGSDQSTNSAEEVIGEIGLVLVVILGIVIAFNMVLGALHLG
jgi:hypothetical protein